MHDHATDANEFHFTPFVLTMYGVGGAVGLFVFLMIFFANEVLAWGSKVWPFLDIL